MILKRGTPKRWLHCYLRSPSPLNGALVSWIAHHGAPFSFGGKRGFKSPNESRLRRLLVGFCALGALAIDFLQAKVHGGWMELVAGGVG